MESLINVATYICIKYRNEFGKQIDEMKLHKLLYFSQRESLIQNDESLFDNVFYGWKYGPVLKEIRYMYEDLIIQNTCNISQRARNIIDHVFLSYASKDSWSLSILTHGEISWKNSRVGLLESENGDNPMCISDIRLDAERIKYRREIRKQLGIC